MNLMEALIAEKLGGSGDVTPDSVVAATAAMTPEQAVETRQNIGADTPETVTEWLDAHVDPDTGYVIDNSLTVEGAAADAKATGDKVSELKSALESVIGTTTRNFEVGKNFKRSADGGTGEILDDDDSCLSEYIPLTWGLGATYYDCKSDSETTQYRFGIVFYDENKERLKGPFGVPITDGGASYRSINASTQVTTGTPAFVRFSFKKGTYGEVFTGSANNRNIVWKAEEVTTGGLAPKIGDLDELETTNKTNLVAAINEVKESVPESEVPITPDETTFFYTSGNLVDPDEWVDGQYVNQTNGEFVNNSFHHRTSYIPIEGGAKYCFEYDKTADTETRYVFYNADKAYISGALELIPVGGAVITAPINAAYVVASNIAKNTPMMIKKSETIIPFESYNTTHILNKYIQPEVAEIMLNLPDKIYALVGFETNVYFENLVENWEQYDWNVTCLKGMQLDRGYRITPAADDAGEYTLTITAKLSDTQQVAKTVTLVVVSSDAGTGETASVIILGDSTTYNGIAVTKLNANFADDAMSVSTLGTIGTAPNNHEGRSGWTLNDYFTKASITYPAGDPRGTIYNPFYNPTTQTWDAAYYFANSGIAVPDWFVINMGINDMFRYENDAALNTAIETAVGYLDAMIESLHSASVENVCICLTIPPNHSQDAFGKAYNCNQTRNRYKRNNTLWVSRLIAEYDGRESEGVYLIPINAALDTVYNMGMESLPVNARNTAITYQSPIGNGGVHPVESGYWQIADVYTAFLKAQASD